MNDKIKEIKGTYSICAGIFPCLLYHQYTFYDEYVPKTLSMRVNYRNVDVTRFGVYCTNQSLVIQASMEDVHPSFLMGHTFKIVFTSFVHRVASDDSSSIDECLVMKSVLGKAAMKSVLGKAAASSTELFAEALTAKTIKEGIQWLRGEIEIDNNTEERSLTEWMSVYLDLLRETIPLQNTDKHQDNDCLAYAREFIANREWPQVNDPEADHTSYKHIVLEELDKFSRGDATMLDFWELCCFVRRFIFTNLARQTKIVAHVVDGIHRLTALETVMTYHEYYRKSCNVMISTDVVLPTAHGLNKEFVKEMLDLSNLTQSYQGCQREHGRREVMKYLMNKFSQQFSGGDETLDESNLEPEAIKITALLCDNGFQRNFRSFSKLHLSFRSRQERDKFIEKLFKVNKKWSLHCDLFHFTPLKPLLKNKQIKHLYTARRYELDFDSSLYETVQVLLWTRISSESRYQLWNFFAADQIDQIRQTRAPEKDTTNIWVTCMIHTIHTSVYYTSMICHTKQLDHSISSLIKLALQPTLEFFSKHGINPTPPAWFTRITGKYEEAEKEKLPTDFYSFITISFAIHLHIGVIAEKRKSGRKSTRKNLDVKNNASSMDDLFQQDDWFTSQDDDDENREFVWSPNIMCFVRMLEEEKIGNDEYIIANMRGIFLEETTSNSLTNDDDGERVESIMKPSNDQYDILKKLIKKFKSHTFLAFLKNGDPTMRELANKIERIRDEKLELCYRLGRDENDSNDAEEEEGEDVNQEDEDEEDE